MLDFDLNIPIYPLIKPLKEIDNGINIFQIDYICKVLGREDEKEESTYRLVKKGPINHIFTIPPDLFLRLRNDICDSTSSEWVTIISYSPSLMHHKNVYELLMPVELVHSVRHKIFKNLGSTFSAKVWTTQYGTFFEEGLYRSVWCNSVSSYANNDDQIEVI